MKIKENTEELKFSDFDRPLRDYFVRVFLTIIFISVVIILTGIAFRNLQFVAGGISVAVLSVLYNVYLIYRGLCGQLYMYTGECTEIHRKKNTTLLDCDKIIIRLESGNVVKVVPHNAKIFNKLHEGDSVRVYSRQANLLSMDGNMLYMSSYIYMCRIDSNR